MTPVFRRWSPFVVLAVVLAAIGIAGLCGVYPRPSHVVGAANYAQPVGPISVPDGGVGLVNRYEQGPAVAPADAAAGTVCLQSADGGTFYAACPGAGGFTPAFGSLLGFPTTTFAQTVLADATGWGSAPTPNQGVTGDITGGTLTVAASGNYLISLDGIMNPSITVNTVNFSVACTCGGITTGAGPNPVGATVTLAYHRIVALTAGCACKVQVEPVQGGGTGCSFAQAGNVLFQAVRVN